MSSNPNNGLGPLLRAHRERQGLTLEALAQSIKVSRSLLDDLERNDVSRWPPGIYGRALVREYGKSIGLPPDDVVRQFLDLMSEPVKRGDGAPVRRDVAIADATAEMRLTLADPGDRTRQIARRLIGAAGELTVVVATACLVALATGLPVWTATAVVALMWLPVTAVLCGHEALYRSLRLDRLSIFSTRPRAALMSPRTAGLMSIGKAAASESSGAAADALFVEPDAQAEPASPASIH